MCQALVFRILCLFISLLQNIYSFRSLLIIVALTVGPQILRAGKKALETKFKSSPSTWILSATRQSFRLCFHSSSDGEITTSTAIF